jgi:hypothetical protein
VSAHEQLPSSRRRGGRGRPLQGSYVARCPDCGAASCEAVTVDQALTDFHARWGADLQEFAGGFFVGSEDPDYAEGRS